MFFGLAWLFVPLVASVSCPAANTHEVDCVTSKTSFYGTTSSSVFGCFRQYYITSALLDSSTHADAVADSTQATAMGAAAEAILHANGNCTFTLGASIADYYSLSEFVDGSDGNKSYCVLIERCVRNSTMKYYKGWGLFAGPKSRSDVIRNIHADATHLIFDENTDRQAAYVFVNVDARSLLLAGAHRNSYYPTAENSCTYDSGSGYYGYWDPSHSDYLPFHKMAEHQNGFMMTWATDPSGSAGPCNVGTCGVIQFHGMSSCPETDAFLSAGYDYSVSNTNGKYDYAITGSPVPTHHRMLLAIEALGNGWNADNPKTLQNCSLYASKNVQGRHANGVASANLCCSSSGSPSCSPWPASPPAGHFLHIEQLKELRNYTTAYDYWVTIVNSVYS